MEKHCTGCWGGLVLILLIINQFSRIAQKVFMTRQRFIVKVFS